ncbi:MAG: polysaccharide biosynthesis tyrosine autokinase [Bacteroidia bacterium]
MKEALRKYLIRWPWILISLALAVSCCYYYLRYTQPLFEASSTILLRDDSKGRQIDELSAFSDLGIINTKNNLENEIEILKSRTLMQRVCKQLNLNVSYSVERSPLPLDLYNASPISIISKGSDSLFYESSGNFIYIPENKKQFTIRFNDSEKLYSYTDYIDLGFGKFQIVKKEGENIYGSEEIFISIRPVSTVANIYTKKLSIETLNAKSNVIKMRLRDAVVIRAKEVLNALINQYKQDAVNDKNQASINTANFIAERIKYIAAELSELEGTAESFKRNNNLVDIPTETSLYLNTQSDFSKLLLETGIQIELSKYYLNYLSENKNVPELLPANLGLSDKTVTFMLEKHNDIVLNRNKIIIAAGPNNQQAALLSEEINKTKENIISSLKNYISSLELKYKELSNEQLEVSGKIAQVPKREREYREIERQQNIKEALYLYLLQKREETALALSVSISNAKVIDEAFSSGSVISPNRKLLFLIAIIAGLLIPLIVIHIRDLFDTKVTNSKLLKEMNVPFLGEIPSSRNNKKILAVKGDKSFFSEAFRLVRTNISFLLNEKNDQGKVIFITSSLAKEGKTFFSINFASVSAAAGKKVLIVGLDLRRQKLLKYLDLPPHKGISNFLIDHNSTVEDFIIPFPDNEEIHILPSGDIPPNPAELILQDKLQEVFDFARKNYDYVIVDTAPAGLVTDTVLAAKYADCVVYLIRANHTDKRTLSTPVQFYRENKLPNLAFLLNDVSEYALGSYPYSYSYSYNDEKLPWWRRFRFKL